MATEGGEQRTGNAVPAPVPIDMKKSLVVWFVCFHGLVISAVLLAILVVVVDQGDAFHRIMFEVAEVLGKSSVVEMLVAMLMLGLLRNGLWSNVLAFSALGRVLLTVMLSARLLYFAMVGRDCCLIRDTLKAAAPMSVVVIGQLALPFWGAKVVVGPYKSDGNAQSQTSVHCASSQV